MAIYKGKAVDINKPATEVYDKISNISAYQERLEQLPAEARERLGEVRFTEDAIHITAQPVGEICFKVVERTAPTLVKLAAEQSPVPFGISIKVNPTSETACQVSSELDVDIPMMLRPMVGGKLQEAADKFSELMMIFFAR